MKINKQYYNNITKILQNYENIITKLKNPNKVLTNN